MKKLLSFVLFIFVYLISPLSVSAQTIDQINSFDSQIQINQDTSITITETIDYQTNLYKHGIYRYIPIEYNRSGTKDKLRIDQIKITDELGKKVDYEKSYDSGNLTLKIGDPDITFTGEKTYIISYRVEKAINSLEDQDELYWDITGEGWQIPISSVSATISSPFAQVTDVTCYSGRYGSNDGLCRSQITDGQAEFYYSHPINYGDNMTVAIALDQDNSLIFPSQFDNFISWIMHNWAILLIPLPLLALLYLWWTKGRDMQFISANVFNLDETKPTKKKALFGSRQPFVYEPLKDLTPGEAGGLMDERVDNQDIVAEILELARKKYLKIELIEKKKLFGKERDYKMTELKKADSNLPAVQKYLHQELFKTKKEVTVSSLKGKFYTAMNKARSMIDQQLVDKKLYSQNPNNVRGLGFATMGISVVVVIGLLVWQVVPFGIFWPLPLVLLQIPFLAMLAYNMPAKTAVGSNLSMQAIGLRKSIKYGKWREEVKEKNLFIEEVLPFAVSLGVVTQLAKQMKDLNIEPPDYINSAGLTTWSTSQFVSGFSSEMSNSLSYNPSSSSSSSGSGFSGSSGGGGGGGGGGSW